MPQLGSCGVRIAPLLVPLLIAPPSWAAAAALAAAPPPHPSILQRFAGFAGRIEYAGHRIDRVNAPEIEGTAVVADGGFAVNERGPTYELNATPDGVTVRAGALNLHASDPLDADVLVNAWTIAIAALARGEFLYRNATAWQTSFGIVVYTDGSGTSIVGMSGPDGVRRAFTFSAWRDAGDAMYPARIVRLRNGVTDAMFQIDRFDIVRANWDSSAARPARSTQQMREPSDSAAARAGAPDALDWPPARIPFPWLAVTTAFGCFLLAIAIVAWLRRDAFVMILCNRLSADPRAWRGTASAAYVDADGVLHFEGNAYRVGAEFFARSVEVRISPLFLRISAPGMTRVVVSPRLLPRPVRRKRERRALAAGFSIVETLVGMALFAIVIVGAVYPALTAVARADHLAAQKRAATLAALNALTDEEMACAYGTTAPLGTQTQTVNGLTITVAVTASSIADARDIRVTASDPSGFTLATLATTVGPPVPPPSSSLGGP